MSARAWSVRALPKLTAPPAPFSQHTAPFWDDPYISRMLLAAHLDPETEAASRRPARIAAEVAWLRARLRLSPGMRLVDLGCGPGLYSVRIAQQGGVVVTGLDLSDRALRSARKLATDSGVRVRFKRQNYLELDDREAYDAAVLVYFDFGVLGDAARDSLLARVHHALRPDAPFAFDVRSGALPAPTARWTSVPKGFWRARPYLELTQSFAYPSIPATLRQTTILEDGRAPSVYRFWDRYYTPQVLGEVLERAGFKVVDVFADLTGTPYTSASSSLAMVARTGTK